MPSQTAVPSGLKTHRAPRMILSFSGYFPQYQNRFIVYPDILCIIIYLISSPVCSRLLRQGPCQRRSVIQLFTSLSRGENCVFNHEGMNQRQIKISASVTMWGIAAVIGPRGAVRSIFWTMRKWQQCSTLWDVEERPLADPVIYSLRRPNAGTITVISEGR
jgi:hypothetical protein